MAAFDTSLTPVAVAPADTNPATLDPANTLSAFVYVDVANIGVAAIAVSVGITPNGGSLQRKLFEVALEANDSILGLGPWYLEVDDVITVQTDTADDAVFSLTGVQSS